MDLIKISLFLGSLAGLAWSMQYMSDLQGWVSLGLFFMIVAVLNYQSA